MPVTFWGGCIFLNLVLFDRIGTLVIRAMDDQFLQRFYTALLVVLNVYVVPSVWRSASHWEGSHFWANFARVICLCLAARVVWTFITLW